MGIRPFIRGGGRAGANGEGGGGGVGGWSLDFMKPKRGGLPKIKPGVWGGPYLFVHISVHLKSKKGPLHRKNYSILLLTNLTTNLTGISEMFYRKYF